MYSWISEDLTPTKRRALGQAMRRVLQVHGPAVQRTQWGRPLGGGLFEFRLRMSGKELLNLEGALHNISVDDARRRFGLRASESILLRVFCVVRGGRVVLLHGYDKGVDPSAKRQQREIRTAQQRLDDLDK